MPRPVLWSILSVSFIDTSKVLFVRLTHLSPGHGMLGHQIYQQVPMWQGSGRVEDYTYRVCSCVEILGHRNS